MTDLDTTILTRLRQYKNEFYGVPFPRGRMTWAEMYTHLELLFAGRSTSTIQAATALARDMGVCLPPVASVHTPDPAPSVHTPVMFKYPLLDAAAKPANPTAYLEELRRTDPAEFAVVCAWLRADIGDPARAAPRSWPEVEAAYTAVFNAYPSVVQCTGGAAVVAEAKALELSTIKRYYDAGIFGVPPAAPPPPAALPQDEEEPMPALVEPCATTAEEFRALQRKQALAPGGLIDRILAEARKQAEDMKPYAIIPCMDVGWHPGNTEPPTFLQQLLVDEGKARGFTACKLSDRVHCWYRCETKLHIGMRDRACSAPDVCGRCIVLTW